MINVSKKISRNLVTVSLISTLLVIWLSGQYLKNAHTQFSGAKQLKLSVTSESTLFDISNSLDKERAAIQKILTTTDQYSAKRGDLVKLSNRTKSLFDKVRQEITKLREPNFGANREHYSDESIDSVFAELDDRLKRISVTRFVVMGQTFRPIEERDENVRMQLFDTYVNLNAAFNRLRKLTRTYPEQNHIDIIVAHEIKDVIWTINSTINQTSTLIESYLLKYQNAGLDSIHFENLSLRIFQLHESTVFALAYLNDIGNSNSFTGLSKQAATKLIEQYETTFRPQVQQLAMHAPENENLQDTLTQWQSISKQTKQSVIGLQQAILSDTLANADSIKNETTINLFYISILVSICMLMAYASFNIAKKIQHQADHDDLTGLPNRRYFNEVLESLIKSTDTYKNEKLILMTLDLNGFKSINDTKGHLAGDNLLIQVADRLAPVFRHDKVIARMGGDEFSVAYKTNTSTDPYTFASQISSLFDKHFTIDGGPVSVGSSIGYSTYPDDASTVTDLQITSDFAMFSAKQVGKESIQAYDREMAEKFEYRLIMEKELKLAIENNSLELYYQPQIDLASNKANAVEALIRWNHPARGMISPDDFIGIAEESGLMPAIGNWVINEACKQLAEWNRTVSVPIRVAVNVSVHEITQSSYVQNVFDVIQRHGISASSLELEITESVVMGDVDSIIRRLNELKEHGIRIAMDDFGTGYSSLSQLQTLPLDTLKIDRSFIDKLDDDSSDMKSVTATIASIAKIFNLETVAEGIETERQIIEVNKLGIDVAQGYYYSKPLAKAEVIDRIIAINGGSNGYKQVA